MAESTDFRRSVIGASDEVKEINCDPCKKDGNLMSAEGFCVGCSEYLCKHCYNSHRRFKALKNHVLQDKASMPNPSKSSQGAIDVCAEKCSIHSSNLVEFLCGTCDTLGCYVCITVNHRQCEKVVHIPDIVKQSETSAEFREFDKTLEQIAREINKHKEKIASYTETNVKMKKLAKEELQKQRSEINKFFDDLESKIYLEIDDIQNNNSAALKAASNRMKSMEKELNQVQKSIDSKKNGQNCELFIAMKKSKQKIETIKEQFNKLSDEIRMQKYTLLPSEQIEAMMRTTTEICRLTTARFQAKIDIRTSKDKLAPYILGLTTVHEHYCVVTDNSNKSVKVVDTLRKCVKSEIAIDAANLLGLTKVNNDCVAISVILTDIKHQVQFFSVSSSGVIKSTAQQIELSCYDLEYCNDKVYLSQKNQITICNLTGQGRQTMKHGSTGMFGISLSPDGNTIYVTDNYKNSVTSMSLDGNVKAVYKNEDLKKPMGIAVDKDGYVYVCSAGTGSIHQLTADLSRVQTIIEDVDARAITFSSTQSKLFLSDHKSTCISVYDLITH